MSVDTLTRGLLTQLIDARDNLLAYSRLRRAQGYVAVSDNDRLRESLFDLAHAIRDQGALLHAVPARDVCIAFHHAEEALTCAALCLMSGRFDCPGYIAVNADKLDHSLNALTHCIHGLSECSPLEEA